MTVSRQAAAQKWVAAWGDKGGFHMTLREQVGQRFMVGFPGTELTEGFRKFLAEYKVGNIILFRHNVVDNVQLARLCGELQEAIRENTGYGAFIATDQEGGPVLRLGEDGVNIPGAMAVAATGDKANARLAGQITGRQLRALGINLDFAPVLDVNCNPCNPVIGVRSYGDKPDQVADYGMEMIYGLQENGVLACAKHFPGHGDTNQDSHLSLPCVRKSLEEMEQMELFPFGRAGKKGVAAIMTAHILFPELEPDGIPATMSRRIVSGLLRERLGYRGLVFTDCMEMAAIRKFYGTPEGAVAAVQAGVDIVLISHTTQTAAEAIRRVADAVEKGEITREAMEAGEERIRKAKEKYGLGETASEGGGSCGFSGALSEDYDNRADREAAQRMLERSVVAVQLPGGRLPELGKNPLFVGCHAYRATQAANVEDESFSFPGFMVKRFGGEAAVFSPDPDEQERERLLELVRGHSALILGTYQGHLREGQQELIRSLSVVTVPVILVALGNPYELCSVPENVAALAAWEYSSRCFVALEKIFCGELEPCGRMPVCLAKGEEKECGQY